MTDLAPRIVVTDHGFDDLTNLRVVAARHRATLEVHQTDDPRDVVAILDGAAVAMNRFALITRAGEEGGCTRSLIF